MCLIAQLKLGDWSSPVVSQPTTSQHRLDTHVIHASQFHRGPDGCILALAGEAFPPGIDATAPLHPSDLLDQYSTGGAGALAKLQGRWALLVFDPRRQQVVFASDRLGRVPLYYVEHGGMLTVSTKLSNSGIAGTAPVLDRQSLYHYVYFHMVPSPGCIYRDIKKLGGGQQAIATTGGIAVSRFWTPSFTERPQQKSNEMRSRLTNTLRTSVSRAAWDRSERKIGAFLSGGLDSSTVAGMFSEVQESGCDAYAIGFDAEGYDEMAYARITARHFGIRLHEYYVTPDDVVAALPRIAAAFDEPFGNSSALPAYFCSQMAARDGVAVLLAGDGGDELFAGNERYAHQKVFEHYNSIPGWIRNGVIKRASDLLPQNSRLARKSASFQTQAATPLPGRLHYYSFLEQTPPTDVFRADFLAGVNTRQPESLLNSVYALPTTASTLNRMLFLDWQFTLADNDLRKVDKACELAGIEVRYPMLDDELVSLSTEIPSRWKLPGKSLRDFYKRAFSGWLPDATIKKNKHGFGLPFGVWMKTHAPLREMAYAKVVDLGKRDIFHTHFLEQAIAKHRDGHASYYGELIWVLAVLEIWLQNHEVTA